MILQEVQTGSVSRTTSTQLWETSSRFTSRITWCKFSGAQPQVLSSSGKQCKVTCMTMHENLCVGENDVKNVKTTHAHKYKPSKFHSKLSNMT